MNLLQRKIKPISLAVSVFIFSVIGNMINNDPNTISTYPWWITIVPIPLLMYFFLKDLHLKSTGLSVKVIFKHGEKISREAGIIFGFLHMFYAIYYFGYFSFGLHIGGGLIFGFLGLYIIGLPSSFIIAYILSKLKVTQAG